LDSILYSKKPKKGAISDPKPWIEFGFSTRPDWWGQAKSVSFTDFTYIMAAAPDAPAAGKTDDK
jgi:hypothetical protein